MRPWLKLLLRFPLRLINKSSKEDSLFGALSFTGEIFFGNFRLRPQQEKRDDPIPENAGVTQAGWTFRYEGSCQKDLD